MKIHKLAKYFPLLEGEEFDLLVQDIKDNGQLEPIVLFDGKILDGVNRYKACKKLGIDYKSEEYKGDDPLSYVISLNIRRRHLDPNQRSMLATEMLPEIEKQIASQPDIHGYQGEPNRSAKVASDVFAVSPASIGRAKRVKEQAPDKVKDIIKGKTTVRKVDTELRQAKAIASASKRKEKEDGKIVNEHPKGVKEYTVAVAEFREAIHLAMKLAKRDRFSPEAGQFIKTKHDNLRTLMKNLEDLL